MVKKYLLKLFCTATLLSFFTSAYCQDKAEIQFIQTKKSFGVVKENTTQKFTVSFVFQNIGNAPLVIFKAVPSCSCMSVEYPKTPINAGDKKIIKVTVATKGQAGEFNKTIIIDSNAKTDLTLLRIAGTIN